MEDFYRNYKFENGYIRLINELIESKLIPDPFCNSKSLIIEDIEGKGLCFWIREPELILFHNNLKKCLDDNISEELKRSLIFLINWIAASPFWGKDKLPFEKLLQRGSKFPNWKVYVSSFPIKAYIQPQDFGLDWIQDKYSYFNLSKENEMLSQIPTFKDMDNYIKVWKAYSLKERWEIAGKTDEMVGMGAKLYREDDIEGAITYFKKALINMPINNDAFNNLAVCFSQEGFDSIASEMEDKREYAKMLKSRM
ncbi:tetratricopeptide repeat protein [Leadbetterella sp. DM7]|uniref:tetratricopeptide repeat protein n=1 Tax=Leadbetterella sp. DM7 TaxID=3235085 RepID=UPI00349EED77